MDLRHRCLFLFYPNNTVLFTQQPSTHKNRSTSNSNSRKEGKTQCGGVGTVGNEISIARTLETGRRRRFALSNLLYRDGRPSCSFPPLSPRERPRYERRRRRGWFWGKGRGKDSSVGGGRAEGRLCRKNRVEIERNKKVFSNLTSEKCFDLGKR